MKLSNAVILTLQRMQLEKDEILHLAKEAEAYQTIANNEEWAIFILKHSLMLEPHDADTCWPMDQLLLEKEIDDGDALLLKQKKKGIDTFSFQSENYPKPFLDTTDFPPLIHTLGDTRLLHNASKVAIIGARSADQKGNEAAYKLGVAYAQKGSVVVSGLALGCDTAAHRGCLDAGGKTIAIVASGLDLTHPKENASLQANILRSGGLLVSEQHIGIKANPSRLVARNRLQAALPESVIVAQCPIESGTMHTVRFAKQYGKAVLVWKYLARNEKNSGNFEIVEKGWGKEITNQ